MELATGYSLWIVPEEPYRTLLSEEIVRFARHYNTEVFSPHITIVSQLECSLGEIREALHSTLSDVQPFQINLRELGSRDRYFQRLFIEVERSSALIEFQSSVSDIFLIDNDALYFPHLSLHYGNELDEAIIRPLETVLNSEKSRFWATSIIIEKTEGSPKHWYVEESLSFGAT